MRLNVDYWWPEAVGKVLAVDRHERTYWRKKNALRVITRDGYPTQ